MFVVPRIEKPRAKELLSKPPRPLARNREILKIDLYYLPNYVFKVELEDRKARVNSMRICVDGIEGHFAYYSETKLTEEPVLQGKSADFIISADEALELGTDEFHRMVLRQSLKKRDEINIRSITFDKNVFYPYWIGYFRRKSAYDFEAIDALSGQRQGAKMKPVIMQAILAGGE